MDAIDAALVDFRQAPLRVVATQATAFDASLKRRLAALIDEPQCVCLDELGRLDVMLARAFAEAANELMHTARVSAREVAAIGSHGQTIRHRPDLEPPFTQQIGDPNTLTEMTGVTVVAGFRGRDVAAGGQGAPLLPVFHDQVFRSATQQRVILNLGGIANVTLLRNGAEVTGFDTGPGNRLLDAWIGAHEGLDFDRDGDWAASGTPDGALLERLLDEAFLRKSPPKSTGRELFNLSWLRSRLGDAPRRPQDVQATLLEFTAQTVAAAVQHHAPDAAVFVCGGGVRNRRLLAALARRIAPNTVASTDELGLDPDYVEAIAFAWFAKRTLEGKTSSAGSVTGARGARILGTIYPHA